MNWLLSGTLGLNALIPVGYYNPVISNSSVNGFKKNVVIGNKNNPQAGGFVGAQIGAIIENSSVTSTNGFTVRATQYAGGFAGISRNGNVGGLLNSLGIDLLSALRPQSLIENSNLTVDGDGKVTVSATDYAGGFSGAMANAYAVNNTISATAAVSTDKSHAGGFTGFASVGWGLELGTDDATNASLLKQLTKAVAKLLSGSGSGAGELLSIVGVNPSVILGTQMKGSFTVKAGGDYAGGLVGEGSGTVIGDSSQDHLQNLTFWKYNNPRGLPQQRSTAINGLESVSAGGSYAGGIAGNLQPTTVAGLLNSVVKIGDIATLKKFDQFAPFTVENVTVAAPASGLTVTAGSYYAGGAIGCATGGDVTNTNLTNLATVTAKGEAGGFIGFSGPGDAVGAGGLNVLGLIKLSGLLSVAQYSSVAVTASNVNGIANGFTVKATGKNENNETTDYAAGGFYGQANSTKTRESHVTNLKSVTADTSTSDGIAGGFVGFSTTGGLADALSNADDSSVLDNLIKGGLLSVNDLLGAMPYLIPSYTDTTVSYVNGGYVEGDIAGGYAGNFQSGKVNQFDKKDLENDPTLADVQSRVQANPVAVVNLDHVTGGAYAGGFGGKVVSGALASAGNGGLSLLGKFGTVDLANLLQVVQGYVPFISYAGVHSDATTVETTSGNKISDPDDPGFTVSATRLDQSDTQSGSAGGYIGYGSGVQVSHSSVTQLRHTDVKAPKNLETTGSIDDTYLSKDSSYAVTAARYAGGYIGKMDIGSAAAVGGGLSLLGQNVNSYGKDLGLGVDFADLMAQIASLPGDFRLRFMTSHPKDASHKLFDTIAAYPKICKQFHLPFQSGNDRVLHAMNRRYTSAQYLELVDYGRSLMPELVLTSDVIVGFPGETEEEFEDTLRLIGRVRYDALFTFIFSPRGGTPAASMPDPTPKEEKNRRFDRLVALQNRISEEKHRAYIGRTFRVLIDGRDGDLLTARTDGGRLVRLSGGDGLIGQFRDVRITGSTTWSLTGELA